MLLTLVHYSEFSALVCLVKILVVPPLQWTELCKVSAPSQLAHVTWIHVTGSRKSWNSWLIEYVGIIKTQCVFQQNQARGQEFISNWCLSAYFTVKNFLSLPIIPKIFMYFFLPWGRSSLHLPVLQCKRRRYEELFPSLHILAVPGIQDS